MISNNNQSICARNVILSAVVMLILLVGAFFVAPAGYDSSFLAWGDAKSDLDAANQKASEASSAYDEAQAALDTINANIDATTAQIDEIESTQLPRALDEYGKAMRSMYMESGDEIGILTAILSGSSLKEVLGIVYAYDHISQWREDAFTQLQTTRNELNSAKIDLEEERAAAEAAVEDAAAKKQEALDAQSAARAAYQATLPQNVPSTRRAPTATSFHDEASAKAFIVMKESGGNYNARNGRYIGAYQLTNTYLNGDYSPENQDRVAENYVRNRYGSWTNAANFWVSHGWY